jgi:hypothetical protein
MEEEKPMAEAEKGKPKRDSYSDNEKVISVSFQAE